MSHQIDLTDAKIGDWTVLYYAGNLKWRCRCVCMNEFNVNASSLVRGISNRCVVCSNRRYAHTKMKHGGTGSKLYSVWNHMKSRCLNSDHPSYPRYGGRGIKICDEWLTDFSAFQKWALENGYAPRLTIERIDNDGGYSPDNCKWATFAEQSRNNSKNRPFIYKGRMVLACDLAKEVGMSQDVLRNRIFRYGWSVEDAISTPVKSYKRKSKVG